MSLIHEQRQALIAARDLLRDCLDPKARPKTVAQLRERAARALRHYPPLDERGEPLWSQDEADARGTTRKLKVPNPSALAFDRQTK